MAESTPTAAVINQPDRVRTLSRVLGKAADVLEPAIDLWRPYVDGLGSLPADGRFLLVGNHTQFGAAEIFLIPYFVRRAIGTRVRTLAERGMGRMRGLPADLMAAFGGVVGTPDNARELMRNNETVLVFPGGGREMPKFKGEEYTLRWQGRSGFARLSVENYYPIVPVALVGSDDLYVSWITRDSALGRLSSALSRRLGGPPDMAMPPLRGIGPTLIPRPRRMFLRFAAPIDTTKPAGVSAEDWVAAVKEQTETTLQQTITDLLRLRVTDPFAELNPLAWRRALDPLG